MAYVTGLMVLNSLAVTHSMNFHKFRVLWMYLDLFCACVKWLGGLIREFGKNALFKKLNCYRFFSAISVSV